MIWLWQEINFAGKRGGGRGFSDLGSSWFPRRDDSLSGEERWEPRDERQDDLFGPPLEEIINLRHPLVRLAGEIDWGFLA
jgi:hypothetical protein